MRFARILQRLKGHTGALNQRARTCSTLARRASKVFASVSATVAKRQAPPSTISPQKRGKVINSGVVAKISVRFGSPFTLKYMKAIAPEEGYGALIDAHVLRSAIDMLYDLHLRLDLEHEADVLIHGRVGRRRRQREQMCHGLPTVTPPRPQVSSPTPPSQNQGRHPQFDLPVYRARRRNRPSLRARQRGRPRRQARTPARRPGLAPPPGRGRPTALRGTLRLARDHRPALSPAAGKKEIGLCVVFLNSRRLCGFAQKRSSRHAL